MIDCSLPQIYEEFYHTINNADHEKDLKWWSNNHGVNMAMNWPQFEVPLLFVHFGLPLKMHVQKLSGHIAILLIHFMFIYF